MWKLSNYGSRGDAQVRGRDGEISTLRGPSSAHTGIISQTSTPSARFPRLVEALCIRSIHMLQAFVCFNFETSKPAGEQCHGIFDSFQQFVFRTCFPPVYNCFAASPVLRRSCAAVRSLYILQRCSSALMYLHYCRHIRRLE